GSAQRVALGRKRRYSWDRRASHDDRFEVRLHHALNAELLRDSIEFIELEPLAAPRVRQRLKGDVEADFVPEPKAVSNRASHAVNAYGIPLDPMLFDAEIEDGSGDVDDSERRRRHAWYSRATRNGDPDLGRKLRSDVVESERRNQADHRPGHGGGGNRQVV